MPSQDNIRETFLAEVQEILDDLEGLLLDFEKDPSSGEVLNSIFRNMHTIKGSSGTVGAGTLERFAHLQEDLLDSLRSHRIATNREIVDLLFDSLDMTKAIFQMIKEEEDVHDEIFHDLAERIKRFLPRKEVFHEEVKTVFDAGADDNYIKGLSAEELKTVRSDIEEGYRLYQIDIKLGENSLREGIDPLLLIKRLRYDGKVVSPRTDFSGLPQVREIDPSSLYLRDIRFLYASRLSNKEVADVFEFALEAGKIGVHLFNSREIKKYFGLDADDFWLESSGKEEWVEKETAEPERIILFKTEIEEIIGDVKENLERLKTSSKDGAALQELFRFFHTVHSNAAMLGLGELAQITAPIEKALELVRSGEREITPQMLKAITGNLSAIEGTLPEFEAIAEEEGKVERLGDILVKMGAITRQELERALGLQTSPLGEILVQEGLVDREKVSKALEIQKKMGLRGAASLKIEAVRLDNLVDMVGELVIAQTQVAQETSLRAAADAKLEKNLDHLLKITKDIQYQVMAMRMLPLTGTFQKIARIVRDASKKAGKEVNLVITGEETEVDKTVIDEIGDPLIHLLRNAVDHGIESAEERTALGKPRQGTIYLHAYHKGGNVVIEVRDDGKGLSREKIANKAVERGLVSDKTELTDQQVYSYIFQPGFSTSETVTELSGRGVGLDVVKKNVDKLRGMVDVSSTPGGGTTFSIRLPLTLAIIDGMIVKVGNERYIVPTLSVRSSFSPSSDDLTVVAGQGEIVRVRENMLPLIRLHRLFGVATEKTDPCEAILIIVEGGDRTCCIMVDDIIGHQQVVIKGLSEMFEEVRFFSGCTILGDGRVGLILDMNGVINS